MTLFQTLARFGLLVNPAAPGSDLDRQDAVEVAAAMGRTLSVVNASNDKELESAFATLKDERVEGLVISPDALFTTRRSELVKLAARHVLPTIYHLSEAVIAGGLMSYGTSFKNAHHLAGVYTGGLLKGEKPSDLPLCSNLRNSNLLSTWPPQGNLELPSHRACLQWPTR